ncbi:MAG: prolyl oligopeptidase family serine peptidase, partial [Janthinobacterium sp.]
SLYDTAYTERYMSTPQANVEGYAAPDVLGRLDNLTGRLLLLHGMADDNVLFSNSTRLIDALVNRGVQFDLMTYPGAKHGISSRAGQRHVYKKIEMFFKQNLANPAK